MNMRNAFSRCGNFSFFVCIFLVLASSPAVATLPVHYSAQKLIDESALIVIGTVSSETKEFIQDPHYGPSKYQTWVYHLTVERTLKGNSTQLTIPIRSYRRVRNGCDKPARCMHTRLDQGAKYLLFLSKIDGYPIYALTNGDQGRYGFELDPHGGREMLVNERRIEIVAIEEDEWVVLEPPRTTQQTEQYFSRRDDGFIEADLEAFDASFPPPPVYDTSRPGPIEIETGSTEEMERRSIYHAAKQRQEIFETYYDQWLLGANSVIAEIERRIAAQQDKQ